MNNRLFTFVLTNHHVQCPALASAAPSCLVSGNVCMRGDVCRQGWRDTQGDKHFSVEFAFFFFYLVKYTCVELEISRVHCFDIKLHNVSGQPSVPSPCCLTLETNRLLTWHTLHEHTGVKLRPTYTRNRANYNTRHKVPSRWNQLPALWSTRQRTKAKTISSH